MTRLFREGRTETVRSCTTETCAFVHSMIRDETVRIVFFFFFFAVPSPIMDYDVPLKNNTSSLLFLRETNVWSCSNLQQRSTRTCTAWLWPVWALIATSSVFTWFPGTWEKTRPSSRRYERFNVNFCILSGILGTVGSHRSPIRHWDCSIFYWTPPSLINLLP